LRSFATFVVKVMGQGQMS